MHYGSKVAPVTIYPYTRISFRKRIINICCLLPAMLAGCDSVSSFSHIRKMTAFQTLKNKIDDLTNMFDDLPHSFSFRLLLLQFNVYAIFIKKINQVQV